MTRRERVLVVKLGALGDLLLSVPHLEVILEAHAGADVVLMTAPALAPLFAHDPRLTLIPCDRRRTLGAGGFLSALRRAARGGFSVVYDLQCRRKTKLIAWATRAPRRIGNVPSPAYTAWPDPEAFRAAPKNAFHRLNMVLQTAGLPPARPGAATLHPSKADLEAVAGWLTEAGIAGQPLALLHAGSSARWPSKRWPAEHFAQVARWLQSCGVAVVLTGGREDAEVNRGIARIAGMDATGRFGLLGLYALARRARLALVNDSGPMHLFALAGVPVYAFFGPTDWERSHAAGQEHRVLRAPGVACSPCHLGRCPPARGHACLRGIPPEAVIARLADDLGP